MLRRTTVNTLYMCAVGISWEASCHVGAWYVCFVTRRLTLRAATYIRKRHLYTSNAAYDLSVSLSFSFFPVTCAIYVDMLLSFGYRQYASGNMHTLRYDDRHPYRDQRWRRLRHPASRQYKDKEDEAHRARYTMIRICTIKTGYTIRTRLVHHEGLFSSAVFFHVWRRNS